MNRFSSCVSALLIYLLLGACGKPYLEKIGAAPTSQTLHPGLSFFEGAASQKALYRCLINGKILFKPLHLSGLLLLKYDSLSREARIVFTNELGYTFFDFTMTAPDSFRVNRVIPQFDKGYMIHALRQDLQLLLGIASPTGKSFRSDDTMRLEARCLGDLSYFALVEPAGSIKRAEVVHREKLKTVLLPTPAMQPRTLPDSFIVQHLNTHFSIAAKQLEDDN